MKFFSEPTIEIEKFEIADVITTSVTVPEEDWGGGVAPIAE